MPLPNGPTMKMESLEPCNNWKPWGNLRDASRPVVPWRLRQNPMFRCPLVQCSTAHSLFAWWSLSKIINRHGLYSESNKFIIQPFNDFVPIIPIIITGDMFRLEISTCSGKCDSSCRKALSEKLQRLLEALNNKNLSTEQAKITMKDLEAAMDSI